MKRQPPVAAILLFALCFISWKLVWGVIGKKWELYDMQADRTELNNLADKKPEMLKHMTAQYDEWATRARVVPWKELQQHRKMRRNKNK